MPRIRSIKPEFFKHYDLYSVEKACNLPLRLAYAGLWTCADKEGRFQWKPPQLKLDVLPYDDVDFEEILNILWKNAWIIKYDFEDKFYGYIPTFKEHQRISGKEAQTESKLPEPTSGKHLGSTWEAIEKHQGSNRENHPKNEGAKIPEKQPGSICEAPGEAKIFPIISHSLSNGTNGKHPGSTWEAPENTGREGKGYNIPVYKKEKQIQEKEKNFPENFVLSAIYNKSFEELRGKFKNLTAPGLAKWKKFVDFIWQEKYDDLFDCKFVNPQDFEKLDFPESKWKETIERILATGIKPEHNLNFRIPQFLKYKNGKSTAKPGGGDFESDGF